MSQSIVLFLLLLGVTTFMPKSMAQDQDCVCTPTSYTFTFDFASSCEDSTIVTNAGIQETACIPTTVEGCVSDFTFTSVTRIDISELKPDLTAIATPIPVMGLFSNGAQFVYNSITSSSTISSDGPTKALQVSLTGTNSAGQGLGLVWVLTFTNACDAIPVFGASPQIGATKLTSFSGPDPEFCPNAPTLSPTQQPTTSPTLAPTLNPTTTPTQQPTLPPTSMPTRAPTMSPTSEPTVSPTTAPTQAPTQMPTQAPTGSPTLENDGGTLSLAELFLLLLRLLARLIGL